MENSFGGRLARERKKAGLSQEELAERLHLTRQTISKWETGASLPDVEGLRALCRALGVSADRLLEGGEPEGQRKERQDLFVYFFWAFLIVMFVMGAVMRLVNHIYIEIYSVWITEAAKAMMLIPAVVFFIMAAGRLRRRAQAQREKK